MALPFLPGNSFDRKLGEEKFHKSHFFDICNEQHMQTGAHRPGIGGYKIPGQVIPPKFSSYPKGEGANAPAWVAYDRQVLFFTAFFQEGVTERNDEQYRIRSCKVYFYLEDDTIQVNEPTEINSGMPQGTIIRRHRIPKPAPNDEEYYTVEDFNIGNEITFYGKRFKLCDSDAFTKNFLYKLGVKIGEPCEIPPNPYSKLRENERKAMNPLRPYEHLDNLKQFLEYDRKVLRFDAYWDDSESMFGDRRHLTLHYYLADDTIEILEKLPKNSGRVNFPVFLHRLRLPKHAPLPVKRHGTDTARTLLNVFNAADRGGDSYWLLDPLKTGQVFEDYYTDADLQIGQLLNVHGRQVMLVDCDDFTKDFYRCKYGLEKFTPIKAKSDPPKVFPKDIPPYSGFGGVQDSLGSVVSLIPKPPTRDFIKFLELDRIGLESHIFRYTARITNGSPIDAERKMIISYYLCDDTISVCEPPVRNSGFVPGNFMERMQVKRPEDADNMDGTARFYTSQDLYIGATVVFNKWPMTITDMDEYAICYMEQHSDKYPQANMNVILGKLQEIFKSTQKSELEGVFSANNNHADKCTYEKFRQTMKGYGGLSEHEIMTVARHYCDRKESEIDMKLVLAVAQEKLKKGAYEDFEGLMKLCRHNDDEATSQLDFGKFRSIFRSFKLPIPVDVQRLLENGYTADGKTSYVRLIEDMNYRTKPNVLLEYQRQPLKFDKVDEVVKSQKGVTFINYKSLLENIFPAENK